MSEKTETENTKNPETPIKKDTPEKSSHEWYQQIFWAQIFCCVLTLAFLCLFYCRVTALSHETIEANKHFIEQISIEPIKDKSGKTSYKTNIDEMKEVIGKGYNKNHQEFMQAYYETQSNWLNFWMTLLAIILAAFGLIIPLSFMKLYETKAKELELKHNVLLEKFEVQAIKTGDEIQKRIEKSEGKITKIQKAIEGTEIQVNKQVKQAEESAKQAKESEELARAQSLFYEALNSSDLNEKIEKYSKEITILEKYNNSMDNYYNLATAYNNRGIAYRNLTNYDNALRDLMKSLSLSLYEASTYANITEVYLDLKKYNDAEKNLNMAKKYDDKNDTELTNFIKELEERLEKERPKD